MIELTVTVMLAAHSSAELYRDLKKLQVVGSALYVAAHPDDENTRLLATLANETRVRTAYLSLTRGEGGQNLIGQELGPLLGAIRTQELLAARRIDGAEQFFTRAPDFGYSKSVDETLKIWDHDAVLQDVVKVIRSLQPDVIITRFSLEGGDTHGHHTASARLALEGFEKAKDPTFHPELGTPWSAKRVVWNAWSPDPKVKFDLSKGFQMDASPYSPLLGLSYGELAALSRSQHKSQGFGAAPIHGSQLENFVLLGGEMGKSLFDGVDLSWNRVPGSQEVQQMLDRAVKEFNVEKPQASVPALLKLLEPLKKLNRPHKVEELIQLILRCGGIFVEATGATHSVSANESLEVTLTSLNRTEVPLKLKHIVLPDGQQVQPGKAQLKVGDAPLRVEFVFDAFSVFSDINYRWVDPTLGERSRAIEVLPPFTVKFDTPLVLFTDDKPHTVKAAVTAHADNVSGTLRAEGIELPVSLKKKGDTSELSLTLKPSTQTLQFNAQTLTRIEYSHIPIQTLLRPAELRLQQLDIKKGKVLRVGYIMGAGDDVARALSQAGYQVTLLDDAAIKSRKLSDFDAIVVGIRAYNTNPRLTEAREQLMKYVEAGGNLLVQYNTKNWLSSVPANIGPFPFEISNERVTDEKALVKFEKSALVQKPNVITEKDFDGWVQERGLYFANKWDPKYQTPFSMADPNEPQRQGGLLLARHGKGTFIYTGISFFRQLPQGVPGAYRLFANLLANGK